MSLSISHIGESARTHLWAVAAGEWFRKDGEDRVWIKTDRPGPSRDDEDTFLCVLVSPMEFGAAYHIRAGTIVHVVPKVTIVCDWSVQPKSENTED